MAPSGLLINACDIERQRYGIRFIPTTPEHEVERFRGKSVVVRCCDTCGSCSMRESHLDSTVNPVEEVTDIPPDHPMAKEFKKMLTSYSGVYLGEWGMPPQDLEPCMVQGMLKLDALGSIFEMRSTCRACGYKRV